MATTHLVFSYGTLKSGEPNFEVMNDPSKGRSTFVGAGETVKRYPLVVASQYAVPFLLLVEGKGEVINTEKCLKLIYLLLPVFYLFIS